MNVCDLEFQGQPSRSRDFFLTFLISSTLKMFRIRHQDRLCIMFTTGDKKGSRKKVFDLDFQGHAIKIEFFSLSPLDSLTPKNIPMRNIFKKFGREGKNPGGVASTPPLGVRRWIFTLGIWGLTTKILNNIFKKVNTANNSEVQFKCLYYTIIGLYLSLLCRLI